jgi:uncharacterized membrane protein (UPF0127 family)
LIGARLLEAIAICFLLAGLAIVACGSDQPDDGRVGLVLRGDDGETVPLRVEIADTAEERQVGLSGRISLDRDAGMLFVTEGHLGFWMKDTLIPLSVAFLGECGEVLAIANMEPQSLEIHNTPRPYSFGLEVNGGWFAANGIEVGDDVELPDEVRPASCG